MSITPVSAVARQMADATALPVSHADAGPEVQSSLELLDDPLEWGRFSHRVAGDGARPAGLADVDGRGDTAPAEVWASSVVFDGITCAACALDIEQALLAVPGVRSVRISAASRRGRVVWSAAQTRPSAWMKASARAGYAATPAHDAGERARRQAEDRQMTWRWLVAGLCMMQVMMYATPTYFALPGDMLADQEGLLRWASWVLSLPVVLFSCGPFFSGALQDLRLRRIGMDIPVALGILITFVVSTIGTFEPQGVLGHEVYFDSLTMFVFFLLTGRWLELRLRERSASAIEALLNRMPEQARRQTPDGAWETVSTLRLRTGDVVQVRPGETFVADGQILQGSTHADEALLTGESRPVLRTTGDTVLAGSHNLRSAVRVSVTATGRQTRLSQMVDLMHQAALDKPHWAQLADRVAKPFLVTVLLLAAAGAVWWWPTDPARALMVAVAVLVVTCPCALSLATPAALLAAAGRAAGEGVLVRRVGALEALHDVDTVVFDKTGTLTEDHLRISATHWRSGLSGPQQVHTLNLAAALAAHSLHPAAGALRDEARARAFAADGGQLRDVQELAGQGLEAQALLPADGDSAAAPAWQRIRLGAPSFCGAEAGSGTQVCLADAHGWRVSFHLHETVRPAAYATVRELRSLGLSVRLLSGDQPAAVQRVAAELGLDPGDAQGGCSPSDKLTRLQSLQAAGHKLAMVGDGLNDAPGLAGARVSFAVGQALPLARAQADFVLLGTDLRAIAQSLKLARRAMRVVRQNLGWALAYNAISVPLALAGWLPAWLAGLGMAASSLLVVLNALRLSRAPGAAAVARAVEMPIIQPLPAAPHER